MSKIPQTEETAYKHLNPLAKELKVNTKEPLPDSDNEWQKNLISSIEQLETSLHPKKEKPKQGVEVASMDKKASQVVEEKAESPTSYIDPLPVVEQEQITASYINPLPVIKPKKSHRSYINPLHDVQRDETTATKFDKLSLSPEKEQSKLHHYA